MELTIFLIIIGVAALAVISIIGVVILDKRRTESLQTAAEEMGLVFQPQGDAALQGHLAGFQLFNQGRGRKLRNLVIGDAGEIVIAIFDYQYTVGGGKNSQTWRQTVASLQSAALQLPAFTMRPESLFDRLGAVFGSQDIDIETDPVFSRMFVLKSDHENQVRKLFDESLLDFFKRKQGISVEATTGQLIMYYSAKRVKPHLLKSFLQEAYEVYGLLVDRCNDLEKSGGVLPAAKSDQEQAEM